MCIVIVKRASAKHPTDDVIKRCWQGNPHGAGVAYASKDGVVIDKGHMTVEALIEALAVVREVPHSWYLVHFRIATHGSRGPENTHPFWTTKDKVAIAHNGILPCSSLMAAMQGRSDTNAFAEDFLSLLPDGWVTNKFLGHVVEEYMGSGNKIAMIDEKDVYVLNKAGWNEDKETGLVYSNYSWKPATVTNYSSTGYTRDYGYGPVVNGGYRQPSSGGFRSAGATSGSNELAYHKSYNGICTRLHALKRRGFMLEQDVESFKEIMNDKLVTEAMVANVTDYCFDAVNDDPKVTLCEYMKIMGAQHLVQLCKIMKEYHDSDSGSKKDEETKKIEKPEEQGKLTFDEPLYTHENSECFLGKHVKIKTRGTNSDIWMVRFMKVTAVDKDFLHYISLQPPGEGKMVWDHIDSIETLMVMNRPSISDAGCALGAKVQVTCHEGSPVYGKLTSAYDGNLHVMLLSGATIPIAIANVLTLLIVERPQMTAIADASK